MSPRWDESSDAPTTEGDLPHIRYAINHLTGEGDVDDDDASSLGRRSSLVSEDDPPAMWDEGLGRFTRLPTPAQSPPPRSAQSSVEPESFMAVDPPEQSLLYPPLDFVPIVLRPWALALLILCCLLMIAGVLFCNLWSQRHQGIWEYAGQSGSRYFVMQFLPQILAGIVIIWNFVLQAAVYRIMPFAMMASERQRGRILQEIPILSRNFLSPDLSHFLHGEPLVGFSLFTIWLHNLFSIPLLSCQFQAKWYMIDGQEAWRWTSVQSVGWTIVALYGLLTIGLAVLLIRFARAWSGLIWDPTSLADLIPIIQRSNILHDFEFSDTIADVGESMDPRILRLGYWQLSGKQDMLFYGMGEVDAPVRTPSLHQTAKSLGKQPHALSKVSFDMEQQSTLMSDRTARYRWTPWFLRDFYMVSWTVLIGGLFIAFVLVSFINDAIAGGFPPKLPTLPTTGAFSSSNFLYSFVPAFIGTLLFLAWQPVDVYFRALQPYATLSSSSPNGARAEESLLLSYPANAPLQIILCALLNKHFKVAYISLISLLSLAIPILAGGVFIALWYPSVNGVKIASLMPAFYALVAFCALYTISLLAIWPSRSRYLPHDITTLAEQVSFLYQSPLLADKLLREPRSRTDLVTRLVMAPPGERGFPAYGFGVYVGRDGREHLGIDRVRRPGREDMVLSSGAGARDEPAARRLVVD